MALPVTSGTASFLVTRDQIITAALQNLRVLTAGQSPSASDLADCGTRLNMILKWMDTLGVLKWVYQNIPITVVPNKQSYTIGETGCDVTALRPVNIAHAWRRDASSPAVDTPLSVYGRKEYDMLPNKTAPGIVTTIYYDPQVVNGIIYPWLVPQDTTYPTIILCAQRPVQDITAGSQNFDVVQEWFLPLGWMLADECSIMYTVDAKTMMLVEKKATYYREFTANATQEDTSLRITPDTTQGGSQGNFES